MATIELETQIMAPIERVFDLARSIDAHMSSATGTGERAIAGRTSGLIELHETVTWEARHFGITQRLSVVITALERPGMFIDEMTKGAFASMRHSHTFDYAAPFTNMKDVFHFATPLGVLGRVAESLFLTRYMRRFLKERNLVLKRIAESDEWKRYL